MKRTALIDQDWKSEDVGTVMAGKVLVRC